MERWLKKPDVSDEDDEESKQFLARTGVDGMLTIAEGRVQKEWTPDQIWQMLTEDGFLGKDDADLLYPILLRNAGLAGS